MPVDQLYGFSGDYISKERTRRLELRINAIISLTPGSLIIDGGSSPRATTSMPGTEGIDEPY
jgi:hypothetical protein